MYVYSNPPPPPSRCTCVQEMPRTRLENECVYFYVYECGNPLQPPNRRVRAEEMLHTHLEYMYAFSIIRMYICMCVCIYTRLQ